VTVSTERVNVALPDKQSLYHAHLLQNFGPDDMLVYVHDTAKIDKRENDENL
jgi:hypothetical protein